MISLFIGADATHAGMTTWSFRRLLSEFGMASSGWDIAMRNIDMEFDVPQFVASSLVRKIAANHFRLPATDRHRFQPIPDDVIARIEDIVRQAYIEAGEDLGGDILREHLWQQALRARREMVACGDLLTPADFGARIGASDKRLARLLDDNSVFAVEVDGVQYVPAVLADPSLNRKRLQAICQLIVPAPPQSRLDFLVSQNGSLGDRPLDMLEDDNDFKTLRQAAVAWAAQWSRTIVKMYEGMHETEPNDVSPSYTASTEIDPRRPLWERASEALHAHGYQWPLGPYPDVRRFSVFVARQAAGDAALTLEACIQIVADDEDIRIRVVAAPRGTRKSQTLPAAKQLSFIDLAKRVIAHLK
ncbi:MAG: hypothetical protein PCALPYG88_2063 [uncultured Paraburkholderia sp.]|uniref:hypothetical protein n=1 Tax=uncultured Paraburkholderia sp. TaxID=1822466 RepID=UPI0025968731|nr:hypothetical protein [uncultured Paraburkholderia sp.]CAH2897729.1 MAG: hypothetical protein PCALPYG08_3032 [uncultured Paraburkholderia sp.]CAH2918664.1 MAG: hypothetical protein PCALPYG88_2063 [uncultured Paraburkholderia sp.]